MAELGKYYCVSGREQLQYAYMKWGWVALVLVLSVTAFGQAPRTAHATYSANGVLIGLADLSPLRDCAVRALEGKVKNVKEKGGVVRFDLESEDERLTFQFPLGRLASAEQFTYRKDFLHKGLRLRSSGYACSGETIDAISIERAY